MTKYSSLRLHLKGMLDKGEGDQTYMLVRVGLGPCRSVSQQVVKHSPAALTLWENVHAYKLTNYEYIGL